MHLLWKNKANLQDNEQLTKDCLKLLVQNQNKNIDHMTLYDKAIRLSKIRLWWRKCKKTTYLGKFTACRIKW